MKKLLKILILICSINYSYSQSIGAAQSFSMLDWYEEVLFKDRGFGIRFGTIIEENDSIKFEYKDLDLRSGGSASKNEIYNFILENLSGFQYVYSLFVPELKDEHGIILGYYYGEKICFLINDSELYYWKFINKNDKNIPEDYTYWVEDNYWFPESFSECKYWIKQYGLPERKNELLNALIDIE